MCVWICTRWPLRKRNLEKSRPLKRLERERTLNKTVPEKLCCISSKPSVYDEYNVILSVVCPLYFSLLKQHFSVFVYHLQVWKTEGYVEQLEEPKRMAVSFIIQRIHSVPQCILITIYIIDCFGILGNYLIQHAYISDNLTLNSRIYENQSLQREVDQTRLESVSNIYTLKT